MYQRVLTWSGKLGGGFTPAGHYALRRASEHACNNSRSRNRKIFKQGIPLNYRVELHLNIRGD